MGRCCAPLLGIRHPRTSGRVGGWATAALHCAFSLCPSPCLPSLANTTAAEHQPTRGCGSQAQRELAVVPLPTLHSAASTEGQRSPFLTGWAREPTGSHRFIWQEAYVQGVAVSAARQLHSRLGNPNGLKEASIHRPACCRSWTGRWRRPAGRTAGSCNPW